ncbi:MAG: HIT family protein [Burkholderiales bacterium]|nr:MAG: HIT family protein [Burkholderiales bacterium]
MGQAGTAAGGTCDRRGCGVGGGARGGQRHARLNVSVCALCAADGGAVLWSDAVLRVVLVDEPDYPGFTRVIWNAHVREMTDLVPGDRARLMQAVWDVEAVQRRLLRPDKVNLASLGNQVPHLHWHVIPRYVDDRHFPAPVWAQPRTGDEAAARRRQAAARALLGSYREALAARLKR